MSVMAVMLSDVLAVECAARPLRALLQASYLDPCIALGGLVTTQILPQPSPLVLVETQQHEECRPDRHSRLHLRSVVQVVMARGSRSRLVSERLQGLVTKSRAPGQSDTLMCAQT